MKRRLLGRTMTPISEISLEARELSPAIWPAARACGVGCVIAPEADEADLQRLAEGVDPDAMIGVTVPLARIGELDALRNALGRPIDLFGLHRPRLEEAVLGPAVDALDRAKAAGKIRMRMVRAASPQDALGLVHSGRWDVVAIDYNVFSHGLPFLELFHASAREGVGVIVHHPIPSPLSPPLQSLLARIGEESCVAYALRPDAVGSVAIVAPDPATVRRLASLEPLDPGRADAVENMVLGLERS
jgi:hypothetical protein